MKALGRGASLRFRAGLVVLRRFEKVQDPVILQRAIKHLEVATANPDNADPKALYWLSMAYSAAIEMREGPAGFEAYQTVGVSPLTVVEGAMAIRAAQDGLDALLGRSQEPDASELRSRLNLALDRAYRVCGASGSASSFPHAVEALQQALELAT